MRKFNWPIRVYYEDTDAGGVVYHANYIKFFERARTEMLRSMGFEQDALRVEQHIIFVVHNLQVDFLKPALFNQALVVESEITELKKSRLVFTQLLLVDGVLLCRAEVGIACVNSASMRPTAIPQILLEKFNHE